jgi:molybdate transport system substrate-binding protein
VKLVALLLVVAACGREPARVHVGAAASLRHAMPELVEQYRAESGSAVDVTYGASDMLANEIERGAALDAVVLADGGELDRLIGTNTIAAASRRPIAANTIVLVGPAASQLTFQSLGTLPEGSKLAVGDPTTVPAGRYAREYLVRLGTWAALQPQLVFGGDVAGVLALAKQGRAQLAIVYRTDARTAAPLAILDEPADAPVASIVAGIATHSTHAASARGFVQFLASPRGQQILARHGFAPPRP